MAFWKPILISAVALLLPVQAFAVDQEGIDAEVSASLATEESGLDCANGETKLLVDEDGTEHYIGCKDLAPSDNQSDLTFYASHWSPYDANTWRCADSYAKNEQIAYLWYKGTVHASGNFGSGQDCGGAGAVTMAEIYYSRGDRELGRAVAGPGETKSVTVNDSIISRADPTTVHFNFTLS